LLFIRKITVLALSQPKNPPSATDRTGNSTLWELPLKRTQSEMIGSSIGDAVEIKYYHSKSC